MFRQNSMRSGTMRNPDQCGGRGTGPPANRRTISSTRASRSPAVCTLNRRPRADLAPSRARSEILISLGVAHGLGAPFDPDLLLERLPVKTHRRARCRQQLAAFAALEVRVEHEPARVDILEQHDANARLAARVDGAESECGWFRQLLTREFGRPLEQRSEASDRVVVGGRRHPMARL
jgi:hypothetical protein